MYFLQMYKANFFFLYSAQGSDIKVVQNVSYCVLFHFDYATVLYMWVSANDLDRTHYTQQHNNDKACVGYPC